MVQMTKVATIVLVAGSIAVQAQVGAQTSRDLERQLRAAQYRQEVQGDLKGAIEEYKKVAKGRDRVLAARALFAMGMTYLAQGSPEARTVFEQIATGFTEPKEIVAAARVRLAALTPRRQQPDGAAARLVLAVDGGRIAGVSADGTIAVGLTAVQGPIGQPPRLTIWNTSSGESRALIPNPGTGGATFVLIAPKGQSVAYVWTETLDGKPAQSLRVIGTEPGARPRVLSTPGGAKPFAPLAWSPDGGSLLVGSQDQRILGWLTLADGAYRSLKSWEPWQQPITFDLSSDGLIAYSAVPRQGSEDRHLFVMDSAGQNEVAVVNSAERSFKPLWTPDGQHILFASSRLGGVALWSVGVQAGRPTSEPVKLPLDGAAGLVALTRAGQLYYQTSNLSDFNQVAFVGDLEPGGARITRTFIGEGLSWSPDGRSLAYIRNTNAPSAVMIRNAETGEERAYPQPRLGLQQARWLPDGSGVVVYVRDSASDPAAGGAMYALDLATGEYKRLVRVPSTRSGVVAVSPDAKALFLTETGNGAGRVFAVDLATGQERVVATFENGGQTAPGISISPDGASLVLQPWADESKHLARLLIVATDGSGTRELVPPFPADRTLSTVKWAAGGRHVFYVTATENGDWRLMRIAPTGGQPEFAGLDSTKLTGTLSVPRLTPMSPLSMDVTPDGSRFVFGHRPALRTELWVRDEVLSLLEPGR